MRVKGELTLQTVAYLFVGFTGAWPKTGTTESGNTPRIYGWPLLTRAVSAWGEESTLRKTREARSNLKILPPSCPSSSAKSYSQLENDVFRRAHEGGNGMAPGERLPHDLTSSPPGCTDHKEFQGSLLLDRLLVVVVDRLLERSVPIGEKAMRHPILL
jgi:hypothetical protein